MKIEQRRTIGVLFGILGIVLVGAVAPNLDSASRAFTFEKPPQPATLSFTPSVLVIAIGIIFILTAVSTFAGPRAERWSKIALGTSAVLFLPLIVIIGLALSTSTSTNVIQLMVESLRLGTPIALGAMAGLWCERAGVVNIAIEGMMLASAGVGFTIYATMGDANQTSWLWISIGCAVLTGGLIAALHAVVSVSFRVDQIISGVVINLLAIGVTGFLRSELIVPSGSTSGVPTSNIALPLLSSLPVVGDQVFTNKPIFFSMFVVVTLSWFILWRTRFGLRIRSVGENPHAAETLGVNVIKMRYQAVIVGGLIAGLAGAWFSMESQGGFQDNMTNGAGFIALAALIFGKWRPSTAFLGAMLFGFTRALGSRLQILGVEVGDFEIPSELWQSLPFVVTIIVVAGAVGRAMPPAADGVPYEPSR
ncbi:MAG TPA: ABC transporter permease [Acidimicrobiales bacterium]|nr:ABC transporter permease [Acidimicrobiales bacterium]